MKPLTPAATLPVRLNRHRSADRGTVPASRTIPRLFGDVQFGNAEDDVGPEVVRDMFSVL